MYNNIEKAMLFMLPTNGGQALTILAAIFLGLVLPVTPPQILWINLVTSVTLALAISFEPHERDLMFRPPRTANQPLLNRFAVWRLAFISVLLTIFTFGTFYWLSHHGASVELSRTAAVNAMIIGQVFYLVNSRFLFESCLSIRALVGNPLVPAAIGGVAMLQLLFTYAPFMLTFSAVKACRSGSGNGCSSAVWCSSSWSNLRRSSFVWSILRPRPPGHARFPRQDFFS